MGELISGQQFLAYSALIFTVTVTIAWWLIKRFGTRVEASMATVEKNAEQWTKAAMLAVEVKVEAERLRAELERMADRIDNRVKRLEDWPFQDMINQLASSQIRMEMVEKVLDEIKDGTKESHDSMHQILEGVASLTTKVNALWLLWDRRAAPRGVPPVPKEETASAE